MRNKVDQPLCLSYCLCMTEIQIKSRNMGFRCHFNPQSIYTYKFNIINIALLLYQLSRRIYYMVMVNKLHLIALWSFSDSESYYKLKQTLVTHKEVMANLDRNFILTLEQKQLACNPYFYRVKLTYLNVDMSNCRPVNLSTEHICIIYVYL